MLMMKEGQGSTTLVVRPYLNVFGVHNSHSEASTHTEPDQIKTHSLMYKCIVTCTKTAYKTKSVQNIPGMLTESTTPTTATHLLPSIHMTGQTYACAQMEFVSLCHVLHAHCNTT